MKKRRASWANHPPKSKLADMPALKAAAALRNDDLKQWVTTKSDNDGDKTDDEIRQINKQIEVEIEQRMAEGPAENDNHDFSGAIEK